MSLRPFLDDLWRWKCGLPEGEPSAPKMLPPYESLLESEWSKEFEAHQRCRMVMGAFRHGLLGEKGKRKFNRVKSMVTRLSKYEETGNLEHLVDVANLCMLEYVEGDHPLRHFHSQASADHHTEVRSE